MSTRSPQYDVCAVETYHLSLSTSSPLHGCMYLFQTCYIYFSFMSLPFPQLLASLLLTLSTKRETNKTNINMTRESSIGAKYPSARRRRLRLTNTEMIGSLHRQTDGEPHTPYHIKPPPPRSRLEEGGPLT
jgi:hypothetical protein